MYYAFKQACYGGHVDVMQWLYDNMDITINNIDSLLTKVCRYDKLDALKWLCKHHPFDISKIPITGIHTTIWILETCPEYDVYKNKCVLFSECDQDTSGYLTQLTRTNDIKYFIHESRRYIASLCPITTCYEHIGEYMGHYIYSAGLMEPIMEYLDHLAKSRHKSARK